jgi:hypothetical protein
MELTLNLGWLLVALWMVFAWLRTAPRTVVDRRLQMVALAMVILILLPAISMTDDLVAAQNPAEIDCCVRRTHDHDSSSPHSIVPAAISLPLPDFAGDSLAFAGMAAPDNLSSPFVDNPALRPIENRPPPAA